MQMVVGDDDVDRCAAGIEGLYRLRRILRGDHPRAPAAEQVLHAFEDGRLVVDDEHPKPADPVGRDPDCRHSPRRSRTLGRDRDGYRERRSVA